MSQDQAATTTETSTEFAAGPTSASGRIKVARKDYDEEAKVFSIVFADGAKAEVALESLPSNIVTLLALHGLSQKLGDSYASVKGDVLAAKNKFEAVLKQLMAGEWKQAREGGEGGSKVTELAEAIARFKSAPIEKANAVVAKATDEQVKAWRANAKIKAIIAEIRAEKAAARAKAAEEAAAKDGNTASDDLEGLDLDAAEETPA
jgi:hypothetical protein